MNDSLAVTVADLVADELQEHQTRLLRLGIPLSCHSIHGVQIIVLRTGIHVLENGLPVTRRPVSPELAAVLIQTA